MKIRYKNDGAAYIGYSLDGSVLSFRGGELSLNLAELERDYPVSVVISEDAEGKLTLGASRRYVAELELPARRKVVRKTGVVDDFGFPVLRRECIPFSAEDVVLTLWALKGAG